jgi:2-polyprenyl-3-methyl-5-hydroxy-6-metoxy-1,4-benzoquinol methylase
MTKLFKSLAHQAGKQYCQQICLSEFETQQRKINERPIEFRFVFEQLTRYNPTTVLDVGTGTTALPHLMRNCGFLVTAIDNIRDYWPEGMFNRHFHVRNDDITKTDILERFDLVTCISVLEHIPSYDTAVKNMLKLLNPGGHLVMTFPFNESDYQEDVFKLPEAPDIFKNLPYVCQVFCRRDIGRWLSDGGCRLTTQEYWQCYTGELWTFGDFVLPFREMEAGEQSQLTCIVIEKPLK